MNKKNFLNAIQLYIRKNHLMDIDKKYIVALSGGADSVALMISLKLLGYNIEAAHCNFKLRGDESERDELFCKSLCEQHSIKLHISHFNTKEYATLHNVSIEMAARELRYSYFKNLCKDISADGICIGHHMEDSVETLLINLIRGTGINGLKGILPKNGNIIRPLLEVTKLDIESFLDKERLSFVQDSTNFEDDVVRNKIRLNIMPLLKDINPSAERCIAKTANRLNEANKVFEDAITKSIKQCTTIVGSATVIDIKTLCSQVSPEYSLNCILQKYSFTPSQIETISEKLNNYSTGTIYSSTTHKLLFDRGKIVIEKKTNSLDKVMTIPECGTYILGNKKFRFEIINNVDDFKINHSTNVATLDYDKISFPLKIRKFKTGDRFIPFGMKGSKLVSDFLTDRKYSLFAKEEKLVVTDKSENILWIVEDRTDNRFRISKSTNKILTITSMAKE